MWQVFDGLFIGTDEDARDSERLSDHGVNHVVNCAVELESYHPHQFSYTRLELKDPDPRFCETMDAATQAIRDQLEVGGVLVHCHGALSRSPAVVLAYLCVVGMTLPAAASLLSRTLPTRPSAIFLAQLMERWPTDVPVQELYEILGADDVASEGANL